jgi:flagellar hook-length control protein FliK
MLELASAPQPKSAGSSSPAALARHAAKDETGFQGLLREAIEAPAEVQQNARVKEAPKPADHPESRQSQGKDVESGEGAAKADAALQGATDALPPAANPASKTAEAGAPPAAPAAMAHAGTSEEEEAAAQTKVSQLDAPTNLAALQVAANASVGQPVVDQLGLVPQAADPSLAAKATFEAPEASAMAAQNTSELAEALSTRPDLGSAETLPAADQLRGETPATQAVQQALASRNGAENASDPTHTLSNALAAGPAQAAAAQVAPNAQVTGGPAKPLLMAQTKEALDTAMNTEALTLLAKATNSTETNAWAAGPAQAAAAQVGPNAQVTGAPVKSVLMAQTKEALDTARNAEALTLLAKAINTTDTVGEVKLVMAAETAEASLRLASLEAPKASSAKASTEDRVDGLAMAPTGFTAPDGMLQRPDALLPSTAAREAPAPPPVRQLAPVVVSLALGRGDEALTISLDPGELGRVEVSIGQGKEAGQVRIVAERPETLALLQRDQRDLDRALNQAGLGDMARSMSFSLASDQGRQQQQGSAHEKGNRASMIVSGLDGDRAMPALPVPNRNATSLIDIAV